MRQVVLGSLALLATASGLFGQTEGGSAQQLLSLDEAIAITLAHDPEIALAATRVASQEAALLEARGLFDRRVSVRSALDYQVGELSSSRRKSELNRRLRLEIPPPEFDKVAQQLIDRLPVAAGEREPGSLVFPDCSAATTFFIVRDAQNAVQSVLCFDDDDNLLGILGRGPNGEDLNAFDLSGLFSDLSQVDERLDEFVKAQLALAADELRTLALVLRQAAASLRFQRIRLGALPEEQQNIRFEWGLDWQHRFRGGSRLISSLDLSSTEDNYSGKRLSPGWGDSTVSNTFVTTVRAALEVPLGRGGRRVSSEAPVRAAEQNLEAARALYAHVVSERLLATLEAFWDVAAAEERLALLEASRLTQEHLLTATEELVKGDVVPAVDLIRNRARASEVASQVAAARQALHSARLQLARVTGSEASAEMTTRALAPTTLAGGLTADPFGGVEAEALATRALASRLDVAASGQIASANRTLAAAAKSDLRPEFGLSLNVSYNAFHESFSDRFYDFEGFARALEDKYAGPSYGVALRIRLPVGNNSARGRLLQAEAASSQSRISEGDLRRTIRLQVRELSETLVQTRAEVENRREAVHQIEATHAASLARHEAGDLSVLDTLLTEQQLTSAQLELVGVERRYLSRMARLRFEAGALAEILPAAEGGLPAARLRPLGEPVL